MTFILTGMICLFLVDNGNAQESERPKPGGPFRYDEDWSFLREPSNREGQWWESLKFLELNERGDSYVTFGNEFRTRYEYLGEPNWGEEETDDGGYVWFRTLPTADFHFGENVRLFGELIIAPSSGVDPEPGPIDENVADILQAFVELKLTDSSRVLAGRRVVEVGSGRLVSTRYGVNVLQTFDIVEFNHGDEKESLRLIYGRPVDSEVGSFNDEWSRTRQGWTAYWSRDLVDAGIVESDRSFLDLYYIGFENEDAVFDQGAGEEERHTIAARMHGENEQLRWDQELFFQFGQFADTDIRAWSLATLFGYRPKSAPFDVEFTLQFNTISGDEDRNDGTLGTFNPLFPKLKYFGEPGVVSPANLFDLNPGVNLQLAENVRLKGDIMFLWRYSDDDGVYGPGGRLLRSGAASDERYIATQYEIGAEFEFSENCSFNAFYAIVPPGRFIRETGDARTINFVGVETTIAF